MTEEFFWDCTDEEAPFGSDEGHTAYYEFRSWRRINKDENLVACFTWIMDGEDLENYNDKLYSDEIVEQNIENPDGAFLAESYDIFTLDTTVVTTALSQLMDEGYIDTEAKPYVQVAIKRQLHPELLTSDHRKNILLAVQRVVDAA
jgi:uncharacterized protein YfeS